MTVVHRHTVLTSHPGTRQCQAGFTLVEMVVVIILIGIMAGVTAPIFSHGLTLTHTTTSHLHTMEKLRYAAERIAREVRQINHNGATYDISTIGQTSNLSFVRNDAAATTVTISQAGSLVSLAYSTPTLSATLADEVLTLNFRYLDQTGSAAGVTTTNITFIEFSLTLRNPVSNGDFTQRTRVALRDQS